MDQFELNWFQGQFNNWKFITTSENPEEPHKEKRYTYGSHSVEQTENGYAIQLNLFDESSNPVTISIPDVENIEHNSMSRPESHCKMYIATPRGRYRVIFTN